MYAENICRVCLSVSDYLTPLRVRLPGADKTLEETIHFVLNISMTLEDGLPDKICNECETMLNGADTLRQRLLESEEILNLLAKEKATDECGPSYANKALDSSEIHPDDASRLPTALSCPSLSETFEEVTENCKNLFDLPEYKIKVEIVENDVFEENPAREQENLDVEDSPTIPKEQLLPKEEVPGITVSHMNKRSKDGARNTDNALKLSGTDTGFTSKEQLKSFNNTSEVLTCKISEFTKFQIKCSQSHTGAKLCSCDEFKKNFSLKHSLNTHMRTHTGDKPYSCHVCKKKFGQKANLDRHVRTHTGDRPYSCDVCEMKFGHKVYLDRHVRTHTGEKPYSCNVCKKKFGQKSNLDRHVRTHTGDRPYSCDVCEMKFGHKVSLDRHVRTHTGEKPYSCNVCKKKFGQKSNLDRHVRTHTGDRPYSCDVCEKNFAQKSNLDSHVRTHTGDRP